MTDSILIIEDEALIAFEMRRILERHGYQVKGIAADLQQAISFADSDIAVALVDLNLRDGLTGPQVGSLLACEYRAAVVFVTANPRLLGDGVAGTIGILTKPVDQESLLLAVEYAFARYRGELLTPPKGLHCFNWARSYFGA